ncbi:HET-domain-containing protein [Hypoxylon crocopeplum]|nr:HET-domain-containing protein [Hypoxylon crocopeplum]
MNRKTLLAKLRISSLNSKPPRKGQKDDSTSSESTRLPLCQRCQGWGQITIHNITYRDIVRQRADTSTTIREYSSVDQLEQNRHCAICASVLRAYHVRSHVIPHLQSWPTRHIVVFISGPFYLDRGFDHQGTFFPRHPDLSDPEYIAICMFFRIEVKCLQGERAEEGVGEQCFTKQVGQVAVPIDEVRDAPTQFIITPQFKMKYSNEETPALCGIEEWEIPFFDVGVLKGWLKHCDEAHGAQCVDRESGSAILPKGFRVIDTQDMKIIQPDDFVHYVALSYMWSGSLDNNIQLEKSNVNTLEAPGSVKELRMPDIIADAIGLCRDLGERYLWVDRLCIIQDDQVTKPGQINAMDRIYRLATFTIVAALNTRDGAGLPGFARRPRHPRSSVWSQPHVAEVEAQGVEVADNIGNVIDISLWNKRGWTFQERLLSKRRLFITEYQVSYECCQGQATELLTWTSAACRSLPELNSLGGKHNNIVGILDEAPEPQRVVEAPGFYTKGRWTLSNSYTARDTASMRDYCVWVKDYSSRQLSFGSDVLNAFKGVGNVLSAVFDSQLLYGLPEKYFSQCLLWSSSGGTSRRSETYNIPSWSWASSLNAVDYEWHCDDRDKHFLKTASLVYFHYQDPDQGLRKLNITEGWIRNEITIEELSKQEELPALQGKHIPGEWRTERDWKDCPQNPWQTFGRQALDQDACDLAAMFPGSLVFNTTVASLGIEHLQYADGVPTKHEVSNASLRNKDGKDVGIISMVEFNWVEARRSTEGNKKLFDFIVLSGELEKWSIRKNLSFLEQFADMWLLDVMLVERLPCRPFVARRIAVGTVKLCKWKDCEPRWETVVLC